MCFYYIQVTYTPVLYPFWNICIYTARLCLYQISEYVCLCVYAYAQREAHMHVFIFQTHVAISIYEKLNMQSMLIQQPQTNNKTEWTIKFQKILLS